MQLDPRLLKPRRSGVFCLEFNDCAGSVLLFPGAAQERLQWLKLDPSQTLALVKRQLLQLRLLQPAGSLNPPTKFPLYGRTPPNPPHPLRVEVRAVEHPTVEVVVRAQPAPKPGSQPPITAVLVEIPVGKQNPS